MFAPEGYLGFGDMNEYLSEWASQIYFAYLLEESGSDPRLAFSGDEPSTGRVMQHRIGQNPTFRHKLEGGDDSERERFAKLLVEDDFFTAIIFHCILAKVLLQLNTLLCSKDGLLIRPDNYVFVHLDRLDWVYPRAPLRETTELQGIFKHFDRGDFHATDLAHRYCFVDFYSGTIRLKNNSVSGFRRCGHFFDDVGADRYVTTQVAPFLSRSIVWRQDTLPENFADFLENNGVFESRWRVAETLSANSNNAKVWSKRGAKPTGAKQEFIRRYPDGKPEGLSAEAIAAELKDAGFPISARQVLNYAKEIKGN